jgi:uncharacterized protein
MNEVRFSIITRVGCRFVATASGEHPARQLPVGALAPEPTTKVTPTFLDTYDAGALYIWVRDDLWLKLAMEMDERHKTRMVTVRTTGTSDDNDHDVVTAKSVFMKISSDAKVVGFYYSLDGNNWQLIRLFKNDYPSTMWVGLSTQSPMGKGTSAVFEDLSLVKRSISNFRLGN